MVLARVDEYLTPLGPFRADHSIYPGAQTA